DRRAVCRHPGRPGGDPRLPRGTGDDRGRAELRNRRRDLHVRRRGRADSLLTRRVTRRARRVPEGKLSQEAGATAEVTFAARGPASGSAGGSLMTRLAFLLAGACVVALFSLGTAADDQPEAKKTGAALVADRLWWGAEFELTLTAPDTGEEFRRAREGVVW